MCCACLYSRSARSINVLIRSWRVLNGGRAVASARGDKIGPVFDINASLAASQLLKLKRAVALTIEIMSVISSTHRLSTTSGSVHPNSNSVLYVYDYHETGLVKADQYKHGRWNDALRERASLSERRYSSLQEPWSRICTGT